MGEEKDLVYINMLEEISLNAWPSHKIELYDGWLIRFSHNYTPRTNSVQQVGESKFPIEEKVKYCEDVYRSLHTPSRFKISLLIDPSFDEMLAARGYEVEHVTTTMLLDYNDLKAMQPNHVENEYYGRNSGLPSLVGYPGDVVVELKDRVTDDWVEALFRLNGTTNPTLRRIVPSMYRAIPKETIAARIVQDGKMVASGLGILDRGHCGIYAIYVDPVYRRRHYARAIVSTILTEAQKKGCTRAYLQCVKGNDNAHRLYESMGFRDYYDYWFRVKDLTGEDQ